MRVLLKEMKADPLFNEALDQVTSGSMTKPIAQESMYKSSYNLPVKKDMPSHNVRVKLQQEDGESSDDQSETEMEAEHQRMKRSRHNRN